MQMCASLFRSSLITVDLIKPSLVLTYISPYRYVQYVMSIHKKSFFSDLKEICRMGRSRRLMHDSMPRDLMRGQGLGHKTFEFWSSLELASDCSFLYKSKLSNKSRLDFRYLAWFWWHMSSLVTQCCKTGTDELTADPCGTNFLITCNLGTDSLLLTQMWSFYRYFM